MKTGNVTNRHQPQTQNCKENHDVAMFKPTRINLSALSKRTKRVKVQLLRDFPRLSLFKGQVTQVKQSLMMNYLYPFNGAKYIMKSEDIRPGLLKQYEIRQVELKKQAELAAQKNESATTNHRKKDSMDSNTGGEEVQKKKITFLGTDITTKDIKIPGLNV